MPGIVDLSTLLTDRPSISGYGAMMKLPAHCTKTYEMRMPRETHTRPATCVEVGCANRAGGWVTVADERTDAGRQVAAWVRRLGRPVGAALSPVVAARVRRYVEERAADGTTHFTFPAGQECFTPHRVSLERPALYVVKDGDIRGNPRGTPERRHVRGADWVEDSALHQQAIAAEHQKG
jgi:hypothetical protein